MISRRPKRRFYTILIIIAFAALTGAVLATNGQNSQAKLPRGKWTLTAGPSSSSTTGSSPVQIYSVTTDADKGLTVAKVTLLNKGSKDIIAVRLHWELTDTKNPESVLLQGDTDLVGIWLTAGKGSELNYPIVSFAKVHEPLLKGGELNGNYRIEVSVGEVKYADESAWVGGKSNLALRNHRLDEESGCANQGCIYNTEVESFQCSSYKKGFFCSVTNNGRSCTETVCSAAPPMLDQ